MPPPHTSTQAVRVYLHQGELHLKGLGVSGRFGEADYRQGTKMLKETTVRVQQGCGGEVVSIVRIVLKKARLPAAKSRFCEAIKGQGAEGDKDS